MSQTTLVSVTIALILGSMVAGRLVGPDESLGHVASYISAVAGALAFVWLIAGFYQQSRELGLQRNELALQRQALDLQREEFRSIARTTALQRVEAMLKGAEEAAVAQNLPGLNSYRDLSQVWIANIPTMARVLNETDSQAVYDAYLEWKKIDGACIGFLSAFASAMRFYAKSTNEIQPKEDEDVGIFVYVNLPWVQTVPHFQQYVGIVTMLANQYVLTAPGLKQADVNGLTAMNSLIPGSVHMDKVAEMQAEVDSMKTRADDPAA